MSKTTNRTVLDLSKVQHGSFHYVNQYGDMLPWRLDYSVRAKEIDGNELALYHPDYPGETMSARAERLKLLDVWVPVVTFQLTANHTIQYTGDKAISMWQAWRERIFKKKKKSESVEEY